MIANNGKNYEISEKWNISSHSSKRRMSSAITATMEGDLMSPEGTQEGKEYLSSSSYQTATTPQG